MKRRRLILLLVVLSAAAGGYAWWRWNAPPPPEIALEPDVDPAVKEVVEEHLAQVTASPRSGAAWGKLGQVLRAHGYTSESNQCFAMASKLDRRNPRWPYLQATALLLGQPREALPLLREAVKRCKERDEFYQAATAKLAETLIEEGALEEADEVLQALLPVDPSAPRLKYNLGLLAVARSEYDKARKHFLYAVKSPFARQKASAQLAALSRRQGDEKTAARFDTLGKNCIPDRPWPDPFVEEYNRLVVGRHGKLRRARWLESEGRFNEALEVLRDTAQEYPEAMTVGALGGALTRFGKHAEAEPVLRKAVALAPDNVGTVYLLSFVLCVQGSRLAQTPDGMAKAEPMLREAVQWADKTLALKKDHAFAHLFRGIALRRLDERAAAIESFRAAMATRPEFPDAHLYLGEMLAEAGHIDEALPHLENAARFAHPLDPRPREALKKWRGEKIN
jgi:tetratricopeptide (TPR) repeat protein